MFLLFKTASVYSNIYHCCLLFESRYILSEYFFIISIILAMGLKVVSCPLASKTVIARIYLDL